MSYGIVISQPGFDVKTAEEKNKVFDSRWNILKYHPNFTGKFVYASDTTNTVTHSFGYAPAFFAYIKKNGETFWRFMYFNQSVHEATSSDTDLQLLALTGDTVRYFIYFDPVVQNPVPVTASTGNFGMRISKPDKDIKSTDINDRSFDSGLAHPMIYKTVTLTLNQTGGAAYPQDSAKVAHTLSYAPAFYATFTSTSIGSLVYNIPFISADVFDGLSVEIFVDSQDVWASVTASAGGSYDTDATWTFKVRILTDSLD